MRRMSEQLAKIHREALQGHIQGKSNVALAFERIDLLLDDNRDVLVGAARRNPGTEAERSVAVICLAPSDIKSCNLTIKLDD
jgi:hypothetical protein